MDTQQKVLIGLVILIVVLIMIAYYHSTQIVGKYTALDATGQKSLGSVEISQRQAVVGGVSEIQHDLHWFDNKVYKVGSFGFGGFALHNAGGPVGQLSQNHLSGSLVVQLNGSVNPLKPVVIVPDGDDGDDEKDDGVVSTIKKAISGTTKTFKDGLEYLGCYVDTPSRAVPYEMGTMRIDQCKAIAKQHGTDIFAMQYAEGSNDGRAQCFIGSSDGVTAYDKYGSTPNCGPLSSETRDLGRGYTNAVYKIHD